MMYVKQLLKIERACPSKFCRGTTNKFAAHYLDKAFKSDDDLTKLFFTCKRCGMKYLMLPPSTVKG